MTSIDRLLQNAKSYCQLHAGLDLIQNPRLGFGTDGTVWSTTNETAVKAFYRHENYADELTCYQRLKNQKVFDLDDLAIPVLEGYSEIHSVIEITKVQPPRLLDFGKVWLDHPPSYWSDPIIKQRHYEEIDDLFGEDANRVHYILSILRKYGIYYIDPKPANIDFGGNED